ncbi:amidohydrolase family protein [Saccharopolyspora phatthalungensis]|uniref:Cytosine/adenosine deaminase-related metal-dependent hydrolase n=1 Tax=Saccharopolyspora phatthalungensis TaxID=664693 RepID=A0A840QJI9_9PSEU|nr:amidohydrolase family protein [Saccharopolyspora phatthalungensis]MBB5159105.1 cytosine/adenosine deaminase-related metal-dependent hydrolase [Saccharopolyspora phatthalungensis]
MRTLIENAAVVTMDDVLGDFERADILVEDGVIAEIGTDLGVGDAERIDASSMIAMPGMVDTHRHTWQTALRGILADGNILDYLRGFRLQMATMYRPQDMYAGNYLGGLDCLNSGVTTLVDYCHNIVTDDHAHAAVAGLRDSGVRALYGHGLLPITSNTWSETQGGLEESAEEGNFARRARLAREIRDQYFPSEAQLLRFGIAPQELAIAPFGDVKREFELARELGARITFHSNQVLVPNLFKDIEVLHAHDMLGSDLLLVHATFSTESEWRLLRGTGTTVSVCAETEMQMGMGFPVIREATDNTPGPSLGIDCTSSTGGDLISHARLVLQATRWRDDQEYYVRSTTPTVMRWKTRDALRWLTVNGARAAGVDDVAGTLAPGKHADIVLLDMSGVSQAGWNRSDPCGAIIAQANSGNVHTVLVDGRVVKRDGRLVHVDVDGALATLAESHDYLYDQMAQHGGFIPQPPAELPVFNR